MDPTPTPVRWRLPLWGDVDISGPHQYSVKTWIGRASDGITPQQAFESLSRHATPFQSKPSVDGGTAEIPGLGAVRQLVDPDRLTIVNTTEPGHELYPGNVHRSIVQEGDDLYVVTHGYGTGKYPTVNEIGSGPVWKREDRKALYDLNPQLDLSSADPMLSPDGYYVGSLREPSPSVRAPSSPSPAPSTSIPFIGEHRRYLNRTNDSGSPPPSNATMPQTQEVVALGSGRSSNTGVADWIASLAGVNPAKPAQPASRPLDNGLRDDYRNDPAWLLQLRR